MKTLLITTILTLCMTSPLMAKTSFPIVCAIAEKQEIATLNGFIIERGAKKNDEGKMEAWTNLVSYADGKAFERTKLPNEITEYTAEDLAEVKELVEEILIVSNVNPSLVNSAKSISLTAGIPAVEMINFFDEKGKMLAGAIIVPGGGIQLCFPVNTSL